MGQQILSYLTTAMRIMRMIWQEPISSCFKSKYLYIIMVVKNHCSDSQNLFFLVQAAGIFANLDLVPSPRLIKAHLPFELLPEKLLDTCKVIFVARYWRGGKAKKLMYLTSSLTFKVSQQYSPNNNLKNPRNVKDAAVSFFHFERLIRHHDLIDMSFERWIDSI